MAGMRSAMRSPMRSALDQALGTAYMSLANQALAILRKFGSDAHVYLPGANGVAVSGLLSNNYTLSDGSTGYSAVDGTAGLVLDAAGSVGAELNPDPGFNTPGGWSVTNAAWVVSGGVATATALPDGQSVFRSGVVTVGNTYAVSFDIVSITSGGIRPSIGGAFIGAFTTVGTKTAIITATTNTNINLISSGVTNCVIDNFSVKQITGIHLTQATTANKPALRRGLYNLLTQSNDFTGWGKAGAPTVTASTVTRTVTGPTYVQGPPVTKAATVMSYSVIGKFTAGTGRYAAMRAQSTYPNYADAVFDLQTGTVYLSAVSGTFAGQVASIVKSANGECTCCVSFTTDAGTVVYAFASPNSNGVVIDGTDSSAASGFSSGGMAVAQGVWTAQGVLNEGGIPLTTSAAASNQSAGRYSWQFDGSNDSLALGSVPFQMSDDHCVIAGFRADAMGKVVVIPGSNVTGHRIAAVMTEGATGKARVSWWDGTNHNAIDSGSSVVGSTIVVAGRKVSSALVARLNGSQFGTATATATFVPDRAYIGTSDGGAYAHSGAIGPVILIKGTISDADLLTLERWVASQTHNGPVF